MESIGSYIEYSRLKSEEVKWLWYPYIPYGKITLLQGDPGDGKSTFMINLASIITKASKLPDGTKLKEPEKVIYQCAEDNVSDTIKPRLEAAGADCDRVAYIDDSEDALTLADIRIEQNIKAFGAKLLILDPVQAFIPVDMDMQNAVKMRSVMGKLAKIAQRTDCAIVLIGHMNKGNSGKKLYRGLGSIDIAAIARSVLMISRDENDSELRYMYPVKSSLAPEGDAISFLLDKKNGFKWIGKCKLPDEDEKQVVYDSGKSKRAKAAELLRMLLAYNDVPSAIVMSKMSEYGIGERTVRLAYSEIGATAYRKDNKWFWTIKQGEES